MYFFRYLLAGLLTRPPAGSYFSLFTDGFLITNGSQDIPSASLVAVLELEAERVGGGGYPALTDKSAAAGPTLGAVARLGDSSSDASGAMKADRALLGQVPALDGHPADFQESWDRFEESWEVARA